MDSMLAAKLTHLPVELAGGDLQNQNGRVDFLYQRRLCVSENTTAI